MTSKEIKDKARELGFDACGIARADLLHAHQPYFDQWLASGFHGSMAYMERNRDKRLDPRVLLPDARSVIVLAKNYFPSSACQTEFTGCHAKADGVTGGLPGQQGGAPKDHAGTAHDISISKYAYGIDYHDVIKEKLHALMQHIGAGDPAIRSRGFTDSAPLLERAWAVQAGLGWTGKNACLIIPKRGSFFFLAEVVTTLALPHDEPFSKSHCGNCTRCLEACPTNAIVGPGQIDARRCISYHTIENKGPVPQEIRKKNPGWVFGCDICQDVCPHNRFSKPHQEPAFNPLYGIHAWNHQQWKALGKEAFNSMFVKGGSPIGRVTYEKLTDNIG